MSMDFTSEFQDSFAALADAKEEKNSILEWLEELHPREMERLRELSGEIPALRERVKDEIRTYGNSGSYMDYRWSVQKKTKTHVETSALLEQAEERGDINTLLEAGLLKYAVNAHQVERLPGDLKAIYGKYVEKKPATSAVTLPKELKTD